MDYSILEREFDKFSSTQNSGEFLAGLEANLTSAEFSKLQQYLNALDFFNLAKNYGIKLRLDPSLPENVGGTYDVQNKIISLNLWAVYKGDIDLIMHILVHEGVHAGIFPLENSNDVALNPVMDESLTEHITLGILKNKLKITGTESGYNSLVSELSALISCADPNIIEHIISTSDGKEEKILERILIIMIIDSFFAENKNNPLALCDIVDFFRKKYQLIAKLFPRLINSCFNKDVDIHSPSMVNFEEIFSKFESAIHKSLAEKIVSDRTVLQQIISLSIRDLNGEEITWESIKRALSRAGFSFLIDFPLENKIFIPNAFLQVAA